MIYPIKILFNCFEKRLEFFKAKNHIFSDHLPIGSDGIKIVPVSCHLHSYQLDPVYRFRILKRWCQLLKRKNRSVTDHRVTLEAFALYYADELDSKIDAFLRIADSEKEEQQRWSQYVKLMERFFYIPPHSEEPDTENED